MGNACRAQCVVVVLAMLAGACGGSGSTGLVSPEDALIGQAQRDGTCLTSDAMVTYCATDAPGAVAPGGATASGPLGPAIPTSTPGAAMTGTPSAAGGPTPSAVPTSLATPTGAATAGGASATPGATPTVQFSPSPAPTPCTRPDGRCPAPVVVQFTVHGLPATSECALAARDAGTGDAWSIGALVDAGGASRTISVAVPADIGPGDAEIALLCFVTPPGALPPRVEELADAGPDVVFAPTETVEVPPAS